MAASILTKRYLITWDSRTSNTVFSWYNLMSNLDYTVGYNSRLNVHVYEFDADGRLAYLGTVNGQDRTYLENIFPKP